MRLTISRCPEHKSFYAITVDDEYGGGTRVTPSKCCGRWDTIRAFDLSPRMWRDLAELAEQAAQELEARAEKESR